MLHFMYKRLRITMWCTFFYFDSCLEKKLVNHCLNIDHSCSNLPAMNQAIFHGVTFNIFGSGLIYGSIYVELRKREVQNVISRPVLCSPMSV